MSVWKAHCSVVTKCGKIPVPRALVRKLKTWSLKMNIYNHFKYFFMYAFIVTVSIITEEPSYLIFLNILYCNTNKLWNKFGNSPNIYFLFCTYILESYSCLVSSVFLMTMTFIL